MIRRRILHLNLVLFAAVLLAGCGGKARRNDPAVEYRPTLEAEQAGSLVERARAERDQGRVVAALEYYERAVRVGGSAVEETAARDVLGMLDGLRITAATGNRQIATPAQPPEQSLQALLSLEIDDRSIPASGVPVLGIWAAGDGDVIGDRTSDASGQVTFRVVRLRGSEPARFDVGVNVGALPLGLAAPGTESRRLLDDALRALQGRTAQFEFLPFQPKAVNRVLVLIEEVVLDGPAEESLLADRLTTALVDRGVKVVGVTDIGRSNYEKIQNALDRDSVDAVRDRYYDQCDFILYGRVQVRKDYVNEGGGKWCVARGRVSLYSLKDPDILASADLSDVGGLGGPDQPWIQAAEEALRKAAGIVEEKLIPLIIHRTGG